VLDRQGLYDYESLGIREIIRDGQGDVGPVTPGNKSGEPLTGAPPQHHRRLAPRFVPQPQAAPEHASAVTRPPDPWTGFRRGIAFGIGRGTLGSSVRLAALDLSEDAIREPFAVACKRLLDPPDIDHVIAEANDHLRPRLPGFTAGRAASSGGNASAA